jgi:hypothetical protein
MRIALIFFLLMLPAFAQDNATTTAALSACAPYNVRFDVKLDASQHTLAQPEPGKARVYFIQDKGAQSFGIGAAEETMIGVDGEWVGANRNNSYFSVSVGPGEHHVCSTVPFYMKETMELAHFTAVAGEVYYFLVRVISTRVGSCFFLDPVDSDQAEYLIASYPLSVSQPKK